MGGWTSIQTINWKRGIWKKESEEERQSADLLTDNMVLSPAEVQADED